VLLSVARGMNYLHSRQPPILHLDQKSPNILIDDRWRVKIADFGLSKMRARTYVSNSGGGGTPEWMAPEVLRSERYDEGADVYSFGVVMWEALTGVLPWSHLQNPLQVRA
jgi:serine/threonine protein kinase